MHANEPEMAERWEAHSPKDAKLPRKVSTRNRRKALCAKLAANRRKKGKQTDPSRTGSLRREFAAQLNRRFKIVKGLLFKLIVEEDAFGLRERQGFSFMPTGNAWTDEARAAALEARRANHQDHHSALLKMGHALAAVPRAAVNRIKGKFTSMFSRFKTRYGLAGARAVMTAMMMLQPVPIPGTSLIPIAVAEGVRAIRHQFSRSAPVVTHLAVNFADDWLDEVWGEVESFYASEGEGVPFGRAEFAKAFREAMANPTANTRWQFSSDPEKVRAFKGWLKAQLATLIAGQTERQLWELYVRQAFEKGAGRSFDEASKPFLKDQTKLDFYRGSKQQFLRDSFRRPVSVERVQMLAGRSFDDLTNVTHDMSTRMTRSLVDGLIQGKGANELVKDLGDEVDLGRARAATIARTEVIRAHAEGQLTALEELGVEEVGVAVEFANADDDLVCPECDALEGVVLSVEEAHGVIPVHPNCRCCFEPANVGEDGDERKGQIRSKPAIERAFDQTSMEDKEVDKERPKSIFNVALANKFAKQVGIKPKSTPSSKGTSNMFFPLDKDGALDRTVPVINSSPALDLLSNFLTNSNPEGCNQWKECGGGSHEVKTSADLLSRFDAIREEGRGKHTAELPALADEQIAWANAARPHLEKMPKEELSKALAEMGFKGHSKGSKKAMVEQTYKLLRMAADTIKGLEI
jgi:SPP1 gp7 family putative phage head morphogenesis protein